MKSAKKWWQQPCTASELAYRFNSDVRTIQYLAERGIVVRLDRNQYDYVKSCQRYIRHLREQAAKRLGCSPDTL
jgi:phage terminase Nu1 subunit (DNA packaging protein)